ncbi:DUF2848 domain-containing protein [Variovorax sp. ZT4R33]|uniref:DUF2848 domain-containing protein n=1 Tax=Variovorax sp. ZT4R33 TaxID=3443743 RepID=UPI003F47E5A9
MNPIRTTLRLRTADSLDEPSFDMPVTHLVIAGWTGSDAAAIEAHILELEALGVRRPKRTPIFYRGASTLLTQHDGIEVVGSTASGEVEPVIFSTTSGLWLGLGSDHTDREVETVGITISKQMCAKPVSTEVWNFDKVANHWNDLIVRSWMTKGGERRLYQEGPLAKMRHPSQLFQLYGGQGYVPEAGLVMFCGTLAVHGKLEPAEIFEMELEDPVLQRRLHHSYRVTELPIEG